MNYLFGRVKPRPYTCYLKTLQGVEDDYELLRGVPRAKGFPSDAAFEMDEDFPDRLQLDDVLLNENKLLVVSQALVDALDDGELVGNELLPVQIVNHKGRTVEAAYYILHQIRLPECIDLDQSVVIENAINPKILFKVMKLVVDEERIDGDLAVFRPKRYPDLPLFRRALAEKIRAGGFTGIEFGELADWKGW